MALLGGCPAGGPTPPDAGMPSSATPAGAATGTAPRHAAGAAAAASPAGARGAGILPGDRATRRRAARNLLRKGHFKAAEATLEALWRTGADEASRTDGLLAAAAHARRGDDDGALALLAEAERRGLPDGHLEDLAAAIASDAQDPAPLAHRLATSPAGIHTHVRAALEGALYLRAGKPRLALPYWEQAARLAPGQATYWRQLMHLYAVTGHPNRLEQALRKVVTLQPRYVPARIDLVRMLTRQGHDHEALATALPPKGAYSALDRRVTEAEVLQRAGRDRDAVAAYRRVLAGHPDDCRARLGLGRAHLDAGEVKAGARRLYDLVAHRVGGRACDVAEASRTLLSDPRIRDEMGRRLAHLAAHGGGADPATLRAMVKAARGATRTHAPDAIHPAPAGGHAVRR